jgi:hypothetical protein
VLVRLPRPFPEIPNFSAGFGMASRTTLLMPWSAAEIAAIKPAGPAPIISRGMFNFF